MNGFDSRGEEFVHPIGNSLWPLHLENQGCNVSIHLYTCLVGKVTQFSLFSDTWSSRFYRRAAAWTSCPTPQHGELSREPLRESEIPEKNWTRNTFNNDNVKSESKLQKVILALPPRPFRPLSWKDCWSPTRRKGSTWEGRNLWRGKTFPVG